MKKLLPFLVSFWILAFTQNLYAQGGTTTPNLGMTVPNYQPGTWGEDIAKDIIIIDNQFPGGSISASISRVTFANLPASPTTNQVVTLTDGAAAGSCAAGGGTNQVICQWNGSTWTAIGSAVDTTGNFNWSGTHAFTIAPTAAGQDICLEDGTNCPTAGAESDPVIKALKGIVSANGTTVTARTITGATGNITVTDGDGLSANPVVDLGITAVQTDQANTYTGGGLQDMTSSLLTLPNSAAYAPTNEGRIGVNTTTHKPVIGLNGVTQNLATENSNVATATALLNAPAGCTLTSAEWTQGINASGVSNCVKIGLSGNGAPGAGSGRFAGDLYKDTAVGGKTYIANAPSGNLTPVVNESDGYTTVQGNSGSATPSGSDTINIVGDGTILNCVAAQGSPDSVTCSIQPASIPPSKLTANANTFEIVYHLFGTGTSNVIENAQDVPLIYPNEGTEKTITQIKAWVDTGSTTINIQRDDGSPTNICTSDLIANSPTVGVTCTLSATEKVISNGHRLGLVVVTGATSGTPTHLTVAIKGTKAD